jgi:hypothetical protein
MSTRLPDPRATGRDTAHRRLRKDRPDLHAQVLAGEITPHAAMIEAGFRRKTITVPVDAHSAAQTIAPRSTSRWLP